MRLTGLFFALFFLIACSESDDGPISIYPDGFEIDGYGYVLSAELDSGARFHLQGDTLRLALDSMWSFGNCFLKQIQLFQSYESDSVLVLYPKLVLGNTGKTDCPQPLFRPDTVLKIPFGNWENVREIRIEGNAHNEFYTEKPDTASRASLTFKDSILVRKGSFSSESLSVYLDSAFADPYSLPRRSFADTAGILKVVDSISVDTFAYRLMKSVCKDVHDSCETVPDTVWRSTWSASDTNLVPIRKVCKDTLTYCLSSNWQNDSTALSDSVYNYLDTTWFTSSFFASQTPECASVNRYAISSSATAGRYFVANFELLVPADDEKACGPAALSDWILFDVKTGEEILDSALADSLISAWNRASVGLEKEIEDE